MNTEKGILQAIYDNPDDDNGPGILADWMEEEKPDDPRWKLIRCQMPLDSFGLAGTLRAIRARIRTVRTRELTGQDIQAWCRRDVYMLQPALQQVVEKAEALLDPSHAAWCQALNIPEEMRKFIGFRRGLPEAIHVNLSNYRNRHAALLSAVPGVRIRGVSLENLECPTDDWLDPADLNNEVASTFSRLDLEDNREIFGAVVADPAFQYVRDLSLPQTTIFSSPQSLAAWKAAPFHECTNVTSFQPVNQVELSRGSIFAILRKFPCLEALNLSGTHAHPTTLGPPPSPYPDTLRELVARHTVNVPVLASLMANPHTTNHPRVLDLSDRYRTGNRNYLAEVPAIRSAQRLFLEDSNMKAENLRAFLEQAGVMENLEVLALGGTEHESSNRTIDDDIARMLVKNCPQLHTLARGGWNVRNDADDILRGALPMKIQAGYVNTELFKQRFAAPNNISEWNS